MRITPAAFEFVRAMVKGQAGIVLEPGKEYLVESRLLPLARREGFESIDELLDRVRGPFGGGLAQRVIEAMTTNETTFFRDTEPFEVLRTQVLPELVERNKLTRRLSIWYAASSTGQEPYSVSMLIREHFPQLLTWEIRQLATDLSPLALARAREGLYTQVEINRGLPAAYLVRYFDKSGNAWQLKDCVRSMVRFEELNLVRPWPAMPPFDVVLIRNVLIYFDIEAKKNILGRVRRILRPDGFLFLGGAETTLNLDDGFERQQGGRGGCYRLRASAAA